MAAGNVWIHVNFRKQLDSFSEEDKVKIITYLRRLREKDESLITKPLREQLFEIKIKRLPGLKGQYRILYTFIAGGYLVVDGFVKKTQKTPRNVLARAEERIKEKESCSKVGL